jgi:vanillin dehydrogenase
VFLIRHCLSLFFLTVPSCSCEELGAAASTALASSIVPTEGPGHVGYVTRVPFGVVFGIAPWNAPFALAIRAAVNPIMAGNTVVVKTSEFSPRSNLAMAQILLDAGLPAGVLNVFHSSVEDTPKVCETQVIPDIVILTFLSFVSQNPRLWRA